MRPIEYRAWDDQKRMMFLVWDIRQDEQFGLRINEGEYFDVSVGLMQFTGFLDKNGVKIWDGDIIKKTLMPHFVQRSTWICEVVSNGGCFSSVTKKCIEFKGYRDNTPPETEQYRCLNDIFCDFYVEIIGNIHEHKESEA